MHTIQTLIIRQASAAWRHRWPAVLFMWLVCAIGWTLTFMIPNTYEASARMYVDGDVLLTQAINGLGVNMANAGQLDTLQRTLLSRPNLEKLISKTDLELNLQGPADRERMVDGLANSIRITPQTRNLFSISYRSTSPRLAYDVVKTMLTTFVESKTGNNRTDLENAGKFFTDQIALYERQLTEAERKRAEFRSKYVDLLPAGDGGVSRMEAAQGSVRGSEGQLQDALSRRATLQKELTTTPQAIVTEQDPGGAGGGGAGGRLREEQRRLQELQLRLTDNHPDVIAQRNLIAGLRSGSISSGDPVAGPRTAARKVSVSNPVYENLKIKMVDNDSLVASLQRQIAEGTVERDRLQDIARGAPGLQAEYLNLNRDYDVLRKNYEDLLARRESMRISSAAEVDGDKVKVQVVDPPLVPQNPIAPKRIVLLSGVLFAGLAAGVALALLLVQMDQSFHTIDDLRGLGLPVVGGVSMISASVPFMRQVASLATFAIAIAVPAVAYAALLIKLLRSGAII